MFMDKFYFFGYGKYKTTLQWHLLEFVKEENCLRELKG